MRRFGQIEIITAVIMIVTSLAVPVPAEITWSGDVIPSDPSTWDSSTLGIIGNTSNGTMAITGGSDVLDHVGYIGSEAGSTGAVTVDGSGSTWTNSGVGYGTGLTVGHYGDGTLNIINGGAVSNKNGTIGGGEDSTGEVSVDGSGSTWAIIEEPSIMGATGILAVGGSGNGTLNISNGGAVSSSYCDIGIGSGFGDQSDSTGIVSVDGAGSTLINSESIHVGIASGGILNITNGGAVSSHGGFIGLLSGSTGEVNVGGAGSTLTYSYDLQVGGGGDGTLNITDGGLVSVAGTLTIDDIGFNYSFINMATGGKLALFGDADDSLVDFLGIINGTDAIRLWDGSGWADITGASYGLDYTLEYLTEGDLAGYTMLTVPDEPPNLNTGLVAYYPFNGNANDESGNSNNGVVSGATLTTDRFGCPDSAYSFDGIDDYVEMDVTNYKGVLGTRSRTCAAWVKTSSARGAIMSWGKSGTVGQWWLFWVEDDGRLRLQAHNGRIIGNTDLRDNNWHHVVAVLDSDGTPDNDEVKLYVDGAEETYSEITSEPIDTASHSNVTIGASYLYDGTVVVLFDGLIDDVRIYDRALTEAEIMELYHVGIVDVALDIKPGSCPNPVNVKSMGVLSVAILGTEEFEVSAIDAASIFLNGVPTIRSSYEDVAGPVADPNECECTTDAGDGFDDLVLKFYTQQIVETLGEVNTGDILTLPLTGVLNDETPIEGADCVVIVGRHKPINEADINEDGVVNTVDIAIVAENRLESSIVEE
jgi:T5SS/PEP-CTERM-associated repeat protein